LELSGISQFEAAVRVNKNETHGMKV